MMAWFTVRVELHGSDESEDYDHLHEEMESEGFVRFIKQTNGKKYHLPTAEYNLVGSFTVNVVLGKARRAAAKTDCKHSILVTESKARRWFKLDEA